MAVIQAVDYDALVREDRVHSRVYTDPQVFEDEMERIFHRGWVFVGHASEIPNPGDYRLAWVGRYPIIMARGEDGQVRLLSNRCRHRANTVCQIERGNARFFRCDYHGWMYRNDGSLASVSYPDAYDSSFRKEDFGLVPLPRMASYRGFIFGSIAPDGVSLTEHLGKAAEQIDFFVDLSPEGEIDARGGIHKYAYRGNWKLQVENSMDGYHPNFVHKTYFGLMSRKGVAAPTRHFGGSSIAVTRDFGRGHVMLDYRECNRQGQLLSVAPGAEKYRAAMVARYGEARAGELLNAGGTHLLVFPNLIMIGVQLRVVRPIGPAETEVYLYPTLLKGVDPEMNGWRLRGHENFFGPAGFGAPDDIEMFERIQVGLRNELDPWLVLSRGIGRERREADGTRVGHVTDEVTQRGIWREWKRVMAGREAEAPMMHLAAAD
ncbi:MAG TPA: aromatic ring-hydroxylating dioxygenase subunit alpha [Xanthobacteraceae bacterium]|nr:aromatic ring-hydroxylating dioxygenase subunit alpha [Xanthobacteraceae bacterium]